MSEPMQAGDAEQYVLGAAMSGANIDDLADIIEPSDFYSPHHEDIWAAILRVHRAGNRPDPTSVRLALSAAEVKHDPMRLLDMTQAVPFVGNATYYARQVATAKGLRRIQEAGIKVQQLGSTAGIDLDEVREMARAEVDAATQGRSVSKARTLADLLPAVIDTAQHGQTSVLGTGWPDLDRIIGGLAPGRLVVVGARPGIGKSLMGTNLALHFAHRHNHQVLLASLEMPEDEVMQRLLAAFAEVNLSGLQMGDLDEPAWQRIAERTERLSALPIVVDDTPHQTVTGIRAAARNAQRKRDDLALVVVDYLQLVRPSDAKVNRAEQIGEISRGLKLLARETGACVVAMAQVNRESTKRQDGRPTQADLRESGSIEADSDQIILLHRPDKDLPELEAIVDKNRHGPEGTAHLHIRGHVAQLVSAQWSPSRGLTA